MTDISNPFAALGMSGLLQNDSKSMPQSMRQKIALAMMLKKQAYPKTFGEGLASIGDSFSEAMMMRQMGREAADTEKTNRAVEEGILGSPGSATPPPAAAGPSPVQAAAVASGEPGTTMTPPAAPAVPLPPDQQQSYEPGAPVRLQGSTFGKPPAPSPTVPTFRPPQGTVGRAPVGDEAGPPPQAPPSPMPPPGAPPPGLPPQAPTGPQRPSVADFGQKPALAPTPPPGTPVMAKGPDPASLPMAPPDDPRNAIALAMMRRGQTGQPQSPAFAGAPQPPAAPVAPDVPTMAQAAPPPPIRQAPPDQTAQIRKAPTYEPDYVPPARPERSPPPTMTLRMQQIQDAIRNAAPGDREDLAARFRTPYENEVAKVKQAHDEHQAKVIDDRAYEQKRQELLATAAQRRLTYQEGKKKLDKPDLEDIEGKYERNPTTGKWGPPQMETPRDPTAMPQVKMNKEQADNLTFYGWAGAATRNMKGKDELLAHGLQQELLGKVPVFGNQLQEAEYRRAKQAANSFVLAFMRDTSGAAYGAKEMYDHASAFLPKLGDDPKTLADKADARERFVQGKYAGLGQGGQKVADWQDQQDRVKEQTVEAKRDAEVGRSGTAIGETVTSKKTGKKRVWDGQHWHDL